MELLNQRLLTIADSLKGFERVCDIGTDHAFVPIYALEQDFVKSAIASDVKPGPLKVASKNINAAGLQKTISIVQSDGFKAFKPGDFDCGVIAGMGGILITHIIAGGLDVCKTLKRIVIQPMRDVELLRKWLMQNGFVITEEKIAVDSRKLYVVIIVNFSGKLLEYKQVDLLIGPCLKAGNDPHYLVYMQKLLAKHKKKVHGLEKSKNPEARNALELANNDLSTIMKWVDLNECSRRT